MVQSTSAKPAATRNAVGAIIKWTLAIALLVLVFRSDRLSLAHVQSFVRQPRAGLFALALLLFNYLLSFYRWKILLDAVGLPIRLFQAVKLGMIGQLFSTVIPGTVGGDFVKAVYVARRYPGQRAVAVTTIFIDRILGLGGVLVVGSLAFLAGRAHMLESHHPYTPVVMGFGWFILALSVMGLLGLLALPVVGRRIPQSPPALIERLPGSGLLRQLYLACLSYQRRSKALWGVLLLSLVMQGINVGSQWIIAQAIFGPGPWGHVELMSFILGTVLGNCAMAVPVAPLGLGVGQVAFSAIFVALGAPSEAFGAAVVTGSQILAIVANTLGVFFFVTHKHEVQTIMHEAQA